MSFNKLWRINCRQWIPSLPLRPEQQNHINFICYHCNRFSRLTFSNKLLNRKGMVFALINKECFYLFIFAFFVMLPMVFGRSNSVVSLGFWLPTIIGLGLYLYYRHPIVKCKRKKSSKDYIGANHV